MTIAPALLACALWGTSPGPGLAQGDAPAGAPQAEPVAGRADPSALWDAGYRREAIELLESLVAERPEDAELRLQLVRSELAVHRYAAALEHAAPVAARARAERARALFHLTRYEQALELLDPGAGVESLMVVDALEALGRFEQADAAVDAAAAALGGEHPEVLLAIARRHERNERMDAAVEAYRAVLAVEPLERAALFGLGQALVRTGAVDEGRAVLERHRRVMPLLDRLDDAQRSVDLAPHHGPNHAALGDVERALGRIDRAEAAYRAALERSGSAPIGTAQGGSPPTGDPQTVPIVLRLARLLREDRSNLEAAVGLLAEYAARAEHARDPRLSVRAGDYLMEADRALEALQHYHRAERMRPGDPAVRERVERARRGAGVGG